jgi:hypothetical protein
MSRAATQEKILRAGIVQDGRIIEERLLRRKETVTVGRSPRNRFPIPSQNLPESYTLVDVKRGRYHLCFEKGMVGKVLVEDNVLDLKTIAQRKLAERREQQFVYPLDESSRGKVVLGDVTLLFQFVAPPPEAPRLKLPAEAKGAWWKGTDRALVASFLLSLVLLGGSSVGTEAWWRTTGRYFVRHDRNVQATIDRMIETGRLTPSDLLPPPAPSGKGAPEGIAESSEPREKAEPATEAEKVIGEAREDDPALTASSLLEDSPSGDAAATAEVEADALRDRVEHEFASSTKDAPSTDTGKTGRHLPEMDLGRARKMLAERTAIGVMMALGGSDGGRLTAGGRARFVKDGLAFNSRSLGVDGSGGQGSKYFPDEDGLDSAARTVWADGRDSDLPRSGGLEELAPARPEGGPASTDVIRMTGNKLKAPKPRPDGGETRWVLKPPEGEGFVGPQADKAAVNKYLRARSSAFEHCFQSAYRHDRSAGGKLVLRVRIDMSGRATVKLVLNETGDSKLEACVTNKILQWTFPTPGTRPVEFKVPFVFRAQ